MPHRTDAAGAGILRQRRPISVSGETVTQPRTVRHPDPRSAAAAAMSFVFPGLGQGYNGQWALAVILALPVVILLVLVAAAVLTGSAGIFVRLLDVRILAALIVLNLTILGWRLVAILQAHAEREPLTPRAWPTWVTAMLVVVTLAMHGLPTLVAAKAIETLGAVSLEGGGLLEGGDGSGAVARPSVLPELDQGERVTILFVGVDLAPGRTANLTDTMLVATLDPVSGRAAMVSIPRDLYGVPLGDGRVYDAKLNSLMSVAAEDRVTYPLGGPATLKNALSELLGTRIHYFAAIDMEGLRQVVDTLGGVDVTVERAIADPGYSDALTGQRGFLIEAGRQHLDGTQALGYARSRKSAGESDFTRADRQQQLLTAIAAEMTAGNLLTSLPGLLDAVRDNVATDIPSARIASIARAVQEADLGSVERVVLTPEDGYVTVEVASAAGYIIHPNLDAIRALGRRVFGSESASIPER
jgi:LCP family protein required for cell wall assembly